MDPSLFNYSHPQVCRASVLHKDDLIEKILQCPNNLNDNLFTQVLYMGLLPSISTSSNDCASFSYWYHVILTTALVAGNQGGHCH